MSHYRSQDDAESRPDARTVVTRAIAEHGRWLRTVLAARGVERSALDDVLQEVCLAATRNANQLRDVRRVGPWLYRIALVAALQHRRRLGRRRRLSERFAGSGSAPSEAVDHDPLAWLLAAEAQQLVRMALSKIPSRDAEILLLKYTEDWSYRELAEHVGLSVSAVEARLHRARGRLREALVQVAPVVAVSR